LPDTDTLPFDGIAPLPKRGEAGTRRLLATCLLLFFLIAAWPILHVKIPPLGDYVNHLGRMHVIAVDGRDPLLAQFYGIRWKIIPNLAMDLLVPPLAKAVGVYWAGKIFVLVTFALILTGAHAVHWSLFRRLSLGPLAAALFVYGEITSIGLINYLFGIGVALWGVASWIGLRHAHAGLRTLVSLAFVVVLFFCHFSALGLYGVTLAGIEAWRVFAERPDRRTLLIDVAAFGAPFLVVPLLLAAGPDGRTTLTTVEWRLYSKAEGLWYLAKTYYRAYDLFTGAAIALSALWAWRRRWVRLPPAGWFVLGLAVPVYIALPFSVMSATHADDRFPIGVVLMLCGFLAWDLGDALRRRRFLIVLSALVLLRVGGAEAASERLQKIVVAFDRSLELVAPGGKILVAQRGGGIPLFDTLEALPCLAMIERSSLVSTAFSHPTGQVLVVKPPYRAMTSRSGEPPALTEVLHPPRGDGRIYWRNWTRDYDYLYVISAGDASNPAPRRLTLLYRGPHFELYRISPDRRRVQG
jgi:hypothetical protein